MILIGLTLLSENAAQRKLRMQGSDQSVWFSPSFFNVSVPLWSEGLYMAFSGDKMNGHVSYLENVVIRSNQMQVITLSSGLFISSLTKEKEVFLVGCSVDIFVLQTKLGLKNVIYIFFILDMFKH
jgi:hypothetical protein